MRLFYCSSGKFETSSIIAASFIKTLNSFVENIETSLNIKETDILLLAGVGGEIKKVIKRGKKEKKKIVYFISPIEEYINEIKYLLLKRQELSLARQADYIIVSSAVEKELLLVGGYPQTFLMKGLISNNWVNIDEDEKQIFLRKLELPYEKLIISAGSVNNEFTGIADFINLASALPAHQFVFINTCEAEKSIVKLPFISKENFLYIPYSAPTLIRGAFKAADLICFTNYNPNRQYTIYRALASGKNVIVRDLNINSENLIDKVSVHKCVSSSDFLETIDYLLNSPEKQLVKLESYLEVNGRDVFNTIIKDIYES